MGWVSENLPTPPMGGELPAWFGTPLWRTCRKPRFGGVERLAQIKEPADVPRLMQGDAIRYGLTNVHIVSATMADSTLSQFGRQLSSDGHPLLTTPGVGMHSRRRA